MKSMLILHDIRSSENVGSLLRTADAVGISRVFFSGITPSPVDRFGRENKGLTKASLGAEHSVVWEKTADITALIEQLKREKITIVAIEQSPQASDYKEVTLTGDAAFILGNEVEGIPQDVLKHADYVAEIPMRGKKESLNVAVAGGVALFRILNR